LHQTCRQPDGTQSNAKQDVNATEAMKHTCTLPTIETHRC